MKRRLVYELLAGTGLGSAAFLLVRGVDLVPLALVAALAWLLLRILPLSGLGRRFAVVSPETAGPTAVTFDDVGGQEAAKKEMLEALDFLRHDERVRELGIRPLRGILLTGPPGTGKTLLAKAAANYTNSVFIAASGSEFVEMYAGVGAQRVRELFRRAREEGRARKRNAVVFIDEIEVMAGRRGRHQSHLEYDQTLNQLLVEMDGISPQDEVRVLVIAATNRSDLVDEALLRPGRFDRIVKVELPDREGRRRILELHTRTKPLAPDVDLDAVARETFGFSGAHLESLANEAAILAMRAGLARIPAWAFHEAIDKVAMGEKLDRRPEPAERRRIAVHEAGHALVGELLRPGSVARVTITSRGEALGYVRNAPRADQYLYTQDELERDLAICLAGALAEECLLGSRSTGAAADLREALALAHEMLRAGMSPLGVVDVEELPRATAQRAKSRIIAGVEARTRRLLAGRRAALAAMADELLARESLTGEELRALLCEIGREGGAAEPDGARAEGAAGRPAALAAGEGAG